MNYLYLKIFSIRVIKRIIHERLSEPIHLNIFSFFVLIFGNYINKINFDLVPRQPYALGALLAFKQASLEGCKKICLIEFGVASGAGLFNLSNICEKLNKIYNIDYEIVGFDSGCGLPHPIDYRDHPEKYSFGDFPPHKLDYTCLPKKTKVILGPIDLTVKSFIDTFCNQKIGFVSFDLDFYSSSISAMDIFLSSEEKYLSKIPLYFDDISNLDHNEYCGELLAIKEFNDNKDHLRKICIMRDLANKRIFKHAGYLNQMYYCHIFDSTNRNNVLRDQPIILKNHFIS